MPKHPCYGFRAFLIDKDMEEQSLVVDYGIMEEGEIAPRDALLFVSYDASYN